MVVSWCQKQPTQIRDGRHPQPLQFLQGPRLLASGISPKHNFYVNQPVSVGTKQTNLSGESP
jgi:hypothetical protein